MAAKKSSKGSRANRRNKGGAGVPPWLGVVVALVIFGAAAYAVLSYERSASRNPIPKLADEPESRTQHDRDQIDQESREQLRDILRAADNGS